MNTISTRLQVLASSAVLAVAFFFAASARAQEQTTTAPLGDIFESGSSNVYSDQFSSSCEKSNTSPYAVMNPLVCHGVMAPTDSAGKCSLGGMEVLKQEGNTCYYCQKINPPLANGVVIPFDDLGKAGAQGFKCGVDQADPSCMAVCSRDSGSGPYVPPPGTTLEGVPPGSKGMNFVPGTPGTSGPPKPTPTPKPSDTPAPPNVPAFEKAMSDCLNARLPYAVPPTIDLSYLLKATDLAPDDVKITPFNKMSAPAQIFLLETAMALQAQTIHDAKYGGNPYNDQDSLNYMVGWLDRCMVSAGQIPMATDSGPNNPLTLYGNYLGLPITNNQVHYFLVGYTTDLLAPPPLMPPPAPSPLPGLVPLKPSPTSGTIP
jgi:hypothetical protein